MQENQTLTNDAPTSASPSNETQKPGLSSLLKSKKAKIIGISLFVVVSLLLTSFLSLSKLKQKKPTPLSAPTPFPNSTQTSMDQLDPKCLLEPVPGPCKALTPGFYYDQQEGVCKQFIWGGCEGVRPFTTLEDCKSSCENSTVNWTTYRNEDHGFELRYPALWTLIESGNRIDIKEFEFAHPFNITIEELPQKREDFVSDLIALNSNKEGTSVEKDSKTKIGELETLQIKHSTGRLSGIDLFAFHNSNYVAVSFGYGFEDIDRSQTINQILSTFKFLDSDIYSCNQGIDCGFETCGCIAKNKDYIIRENNICPVECGQPKCINSKCVIPHECQSCPKLMPSHPDFCQNGTKIPGEIDECGCQLPPTCLQE